MKRQNSSFDVVISGAGMVGTTAACLFAKQGLKVGLLDSNSVTDWQPDVIYPRVSAVNIASVHIFKWLEVWQSIVDKRVSPFHAMHVWEEHSEASIHFDAPTPGSTKSRLHHRKQRHHQLPDRKIAPELQCTDYGQLRIVRASNS